MIESGGAALERGMKLPACLSALSAQLAADREALRAEMHALGESGVQRHQNEEAPLRGQCQARSGRHLHHQAPVHGDGATPSIALLS